MYYVPEQLYHNQKKIPAFDFLKYAEEQMLQYKLSPAAICGRAQSAGSFPQAVCTKTLYNYIDRCLLKVRNLDLPFKVKRRIRPKEQRQEKSSYGRSIHERPAVVEIREEFGHWEIDTVVGNKEKAPVLLTLAERQTRFRYIIKIASRNAVAVQEGLEKITSLYGSSFTSVFKTISCDNGSEFAKLPELLPDTGVYYADPYASYQLGTNEKQNSLIRKFISKGQNMTDISQETIAAIEDWINNLPGKIFNYHSANEFF